MDSKYTGGLSIAMILKSLSEKQPADPNELDLWALRTCEKTPERFKRSRKRDNVQKGSAPSQSRRAADRCPELSRIRPREHMLDLGLALSSLTFGYEVNWQDRKLTVRLDVDSPIL